MNGRLKALLVGGPMYDPLYTRLAEFEEIQGLSVERVVAVEDAIWEGIREALLGNKSVKKALEDTEAAARLAAEGAPIQEE